MMLNTPPPGYNVDTLNGQNNQILGQPNSALSNNVLGYNPEQYKSSFAQPSSAFIPSSVNAPNPFYNQQPQQPNSPAAMIKALMGAQNG